mgnify:CR=1 FL=1
MLFRSGGSRLLVWRDTLRMSATHPLLGFGPDTFAAVFPRYESRELARAYPDFAHESPHNVLLDALYSRGVLGTALALALWVLAWRRNRAVAGGAFAALQFICFTAPLAMLFPLPEIPPRSGRRWWLAPVALVFMVSAYRLASSDYWVARADRDPSAYRATAPVQADLYFARKWSSPEIATLAVRDPEQAHNAWYQAAMLVAQRGDQAQVELGLKAAIAVAPMWYKPRWALARLLQAAALPDEARREAEIALDLNGAKNSKRARKNSAFG